MTTNYRIKIKRATSTRWSEINPVLLAGELGLESDMARLKVGDGVSTWNDLEYLYVDPSPIDNITYGRKNGEWVDIYSAANLQISTGTATEVNSYIPLSGEPIYDTTNKILYIGDGSTVRGNLVSNSSKLVSLASSVLYAGPAYSTPLTVSLNSINSIWEIITSISFSSADGANETIINLFPSINNLTILSFDSISSINDLNTSLHGSNISSITLSTSDVNEYSYIKCNHLVQLTGSSANFGISMIENSIFDNYITDMKIIAKRIS
jgi:hypothetical protein